LFINKIKSNFSKKSNANECLRKKLFIKMNKDMLSFFLMHFRIILNIFHFLIKIVDNKSFRNSKA